MTAIVVHRMPPEKRRNYAFGFRGRRVRVGIDTYRDGELNYVEGRVVAVAVPNTGTVADQLILEGDPGYFARALSLATVSTIEAVNDKTGDSA